MSDDKNKSDQKNKGSAYRKSASGRVILNEDRRRSTISESKPAPSRPRREGSSPPSKKGNDGN